MVEKTVLHLISPIGFFGAENVMVQLAKELCSLKYKVYVGILGNTQGSHREAAQEAEKHGLNVEIFRCNGKLDIKTIFRIRQYIKHNGISIVHSHGYKSNFYSILASARMNIKKVTTCHNWLGDDLKMRFYTRLDKALLNRFDRVVVVSNDLRDKISKKAASQDKVIVINNGVDIDKFKFASRDSEIKESMGLREGEPVIVSIGRLTEEKGLIYLIKAFVKIVSEYPRAKLLIVGDGPLRSFLELEIKSLELENNVIFAGIRNDIPEILAMANVFVLPSLEEAMPMALLEAMAAKSPIVATGVGAISNIIKDRYSGLIVEPKDPFALSRSILCLLQNKDMARSFGENSYNSVKNNFSANRMAQEYAKAYNNID